MQEEQVVAFLNAIRAKRVRVKTKGWVEACCPLARWLHKKHHDTNPSFGISTDPEGRSGYHCFACESGSLEDLLSRIAYYDLAHLDQYDLRTAYDILYGEPTGPSILPYNPEPQPSTVFQPWPGHWIESFLPVEYYEPALEYMATRNWPTSYIEQFQLRFDTQRKMLVCPYWSVYGKLAGARGRAIRDDVSGASKLWDYTVEGKNNCRLSWYNESCLNLPGPVVVVEGQADVWRVAQGYPKVVGNLTAKPTLEKMEKLRDCPFLIQIPDNDETGERSIAAYRRFCNQLHLRHKVLKLDDAVKDPDQCHPDYLKDQIAKLL
jgi:hypothetical protein